MTESQAQELMAQGDALRDAGDFAAAAQSYRAALDAGANSGARRQLANMLKDSGAHQDAEAEYRLCLREAPDDPDLHLQIGHLYKLWGRPSDSAASYRAAARNGSREAAAELEALRPDTAPSAGMGRREIDAMITRAIDERLRIAPAIEDQDLLALVLDLQREVAELKAAIRAHKGEA